ncbi:alpha-amylase family protein [Lacticaseibacillus suihuaensis]
MKMEDQTLTIDGAWQLQALAPFAVTADGTRLTPTETPVAAATTVAFGDRTLAATTTTFALSEGTATIIAAALSATTGLVQVSVTGADQTTVALRQVGLTATLAGTAAWRMLAVPFDNDKWAKFVDYPLSEAREIYGFTALHASGDNTGLVVGAVDHDTWKSAINVVDATAARVQIYSGATSEVTRDFDGAVHGTVSGPTVSSARFFVGQFADFQAGLAQLGDALKVVQPPLTWSHPVPVGWNTWAAFMGNITYDRFLISADYLAQHKEFSDAKGNQWLNLDASWNKFTDRMKVLPARLQENGQIAGSYLAPFISGGNFDEYVSGTDDNYRLKDIVLRDHAGNILPPVDGLYSLDPTHPGTIQHLQYDLDRIVAWGFRFVKIDFLGHASREGAFYDPSITTGMAAYNFAMKQITARLAPERIGYDMFISLSIAPIFPGGYGHARRISCDAFGALDQSEYVNNSMTYLWWLQGRQFAYNDPDHIVLFHSNDSDSISLAEAKTRFSTGLISGLKLISEDFAVPQARANAESIFGNAAIMALVKKDLAFRPVGEPLLGKASATVFYARDTDATYVACFNYSLSEPADLNLDLAAVGVGQHGIITELWHNQPVVAGAILAATLAPKETLIFKIAD